MKWVSAEEAMLSLKTGDNVYIHSVAAAPSALVSAMTERGKKLEGINVYHLHTEGVAPYAAPELADKFHIHALFVGANVRAAV